MGLLFKDKQEIETYISEYGQIDIRTIALSSLEYLFKVERLSLSDISHLFQVSVEEVKDIFDRNGML